MNQSERQIKTSTDLRNLQGQFDIIKTQSVYALSIGINVGASDIKVSFEDLGFDEEDAKRKRQAQLKAPPIVVFPQLRLYGNKLGTLKKELQDKYMISGSKRWWFVLDSRIDDLWHDIETTLMPTVETYREEILACYDKAQSDYQHRVLEAFAGKLDAAPQTDVLKKYMGKFPSQSDVTERFSVAIDGPIRISSILEDAAVAEKASILALHKQWKDSIMQCLQGSLQEAEREIYEVVSDLLERMENKPAGGLSQVAKDKFDEIVARLNLLVDFNSSLEDIANNVPLAVAKTTQKITKEYEAATDDGMNPRELCLTHIKFKRRLDDLRLQLNTKADLQTKGSGGHRKIGQWMLSNED